MPKVSAVIITLNEEKNIERCLKSLIGIVDEIIVVDSFSKDNTPEICKKYNVKFSQRKFDNYSNQKNFGAEQASNNYILSVDADEVISDELWESIKKIKQNIEFDGYYINRLNNYCGKWIYFCGWYPDKKLRLYDKTKARWGGKKIHETLIIDKDANIGKLKGNLKHYSYNNISHHISQINKYTEQQALENFQNGKKIFMPFIFFSFIFTLIHRYILKLGVLDGYYGLVICILTAYGKFNKNAKLWQLKKLNKHD